MPLTDRSLQTVWLRSLLFVLLCYALLGKSFAYLFAGEMILVTGVLIFLPGRRIMLIFSDPVLFLWALFACWGFCRTVPFLAQYGLATVRDGVLWGYGSFALLIAAFINKTEQISRALNIYRRFLLWYLPVLPCLLLITILLAHQMPTLPWSNDVPILFLKGGDVAVHLAGAALFLLLFSAGRPGGIPSISLYRVISLAGWLAAALYVLIDNRGGFLGMMGAITFVSLLWLRKLAWKAGSFASIAIVIAVLILESNLIPLKVNGGRSFTLGQVAENISSVAGSSTGTNTQGSKEWRLLWWRNIVRYTVFGPYFWTGKGFGVNLAVEDGPPGVTADELSLRSPHNGNMTVLARMGVPGLTIWAALNCLFAFRLLRGWRRSTRAGSQFWASLYLWIFGYWLAAFINMSFDVYLEGPQGGIWFWSLIGFGVAALRVQAYEARQTDARRRSQAEPSFPDRALAPA